MITTTYAAWSENLKLIRIKAKRFDDVAKILSLVMRANETVEEAASRIRDAVRKLEVTGGL